MRALFFLASVVAFCATASAQQYPPPQPYSPPQPQHQAVPAPQPQYQPPPPQRPGVYAVPTPPPAYPPGYQPPPPAYAPPPPAYQQPVPYVPSRPVPAHPSHPRRSTLQHVRTAITGDFMTPVQGYWTERVGFGASVGGWIESASIAMQPRLGLHYGPGNQGAYYLDIGGDFGLAWVPLPQLPHTPFVGAGLGGRYLHLRGREMRMTVGEVIQLTEMTSQSTTHFSFSAFGRIGAMFFRDSPVNMIVSADYLVSFIAGDDPAAGLFSVGVAF